MRKTGAAPTLFVLFLSAVLIETLSVDLARAFPNEIEYKTPPIVTIHSPVNNATFTVDNVLLDFTVTRPDYWLFHGGYAAQQILKSVNYQLDGKQYDPIPVNSTLESPFEYSLKLTNLTDGEYSLRVYAYASGWVIQMNGFYEYEVPINSSSDMIYFTVDTTPPKIAVLSLEEKTYYTSNVQLNFTVNELTTQIKYSLDGQENVTIAGNKTLTNLFYGEHNITVFATDEVGNIGASETINFTVAVPEPEPEPFPTIPVAAVSAVLIAAVAAGLVLFTRRRRRKEAQQK